MIVRRFTLDDQQSFARLSGDWNPMHVDPVAARRTNLGRVVVHGVHLVVWALDRLAATGYRFSLNRIKADFSRPAFVSDEVTLNLDLSQPGKAIARLSSENGTLAVIRLDLGTTLPRRPVSVHGPERETAHDLTLTELEGRAGNLPVGFDGALLNSLYPDLMAADLPQVATLLACTRLVGMRCPGLHSILGGLTLSFTPGQDPETALDWRVTQVDERFSLVRLSVTGSTASGTIDTYRRPSPVGLPTASEIMERSHPGRHADWNALVVGGSRGLGAAAAALLAAGGASVRLTWKAGADDAAQVIARAGECGATDIQALAFDAEAPAALDDLQARLESWRPTHILAFSSPRILPTAKAGWSQARFDEYRRHFLDLPLALATHFAPTRLFYPSTEFLNQSSEPWQEYCAAKAAGEAALAVLPQVECLIRRLPRSATDQTLALTPIQSQPAIDVMARVLEDWS